MAINGISPNNIWGLKSSKNSNTKAKNLPCNNHQAKSLNKSTLNNYYPHNFLAFTGRPLSVKPLEKTRLFNQYKKFVVDNDFNVIGFLQQTNVKPALVREFLTAITADPKASKNFINEITRDMTKPNAPVNPRKSKQIVKLLAEKLGGENNFKDWYNHPNGYFNAFTNYLKDFYKEAKSVNELVEFSPNWGSWKLREKSIALNKSGKPGFVLGGLPKEFKSIDDFRNLVNQIRLNNDKKIDLNSKIADFKIKPLGNSASGKFIVSLDDKYVLKTHYHSIKEKTYQDDIIAQNADSAYLNGIVDYYTNFHKCKNSAKMLMYDYNSDSVLYEFTKGAPINVKNKTDNDTLGNIREINTKLKDLNLLGLNVTDRGLANYLEKNGKTVVIDSGHISYSDILKPGMTGYNICLPNKTGFNQLEFNGTLDSILASKK